MACEPMKWALEPTMPATEPITRAMWPMQRLISIVHRNCFLAERKALTIISQEILTR